MVWRRSWRGRRSRAIARAIDTSSPEGRRASVDIGDAVLVKKKRRSPNSLREGRIIEKPPINTNPVDANAAFDFVPDIDEIVELESARSLDENALRTISLQARTAIGFVARPVPRDLLARAVELALLGPTSANSLPLKMVFVETPTNLAAPVTAIIATDLKFYDQFPRTFPERADGLLHLRSAFGRLDAGPMAGFERPIVDAASA